jgi:hypothetical protein
MRLFRQAHPVEQVHHILAIVVDLLAGDAQGERHIVEGGEMIEQAEFLEHDSDAPPHQGQLALFQAADVAVEEIDQAARGLEREEHHAEQGGLARA